MPSTRFFNDSKWIHSVCDRQFCVWVLMIYLRVSLPVQTRHNSRVHGEGGKVFADAAWESRRMFGDFEAVYKEFKRQNDFALDGALDTQCDRMNRMGWHLPITAYYSSRLHFFFYRPHRLSVATESRSVGSSMSQGQRNSIELVSCMLSLL